jgi:DNA-directed RNA polymerase subunit RPC12/RpoP
MSHVKCPKCLHTVRVKPDGTIAYHVGIQWSNKACVAFKTPAAWSVPSALIAHGKSSRGDCMRCGRHVSDGPADDCPQCNIKVYRDDDLRKAAYEKDRKSREN